jgi:alkylation response protein AidB-like acyl-CoA dehydrogenase
MCTGVTLAGVAVAQLRRPGPPAVTAIRVEGGWRFDGHVGWMTSWGICDVVLLGGLSPAGEVVTVLIPARDGDGLTASEPMQLAAMQATVTVTLDLDGCTVPDADVVVVQDAAAWLVVDAAKTANASPHTFGLQRECVRRLAETASQRDDGTAAALAQQLGQEGERLRAVAVRASSLELVVRTAAALVAATGGSAMALSAAPQRLMREAVFHLVQAQTAPVREATLQLFRESGP